MINLRLEIWRAILAHKPNNVFDVAPRRFRNLHYSTAARRSLGRPI